MKLKLCFPLIVLILLSQAACAGWLLIPMDAGGQTNHLKAYGIVYAAIQKGIKTEWLLNYRGGSFLIDEDAGIAQFCGERGVSYIKISEKQYDQVIKEVSSISFNGAVVKLEKAPRIAVYTPPSKMPWDDAVTLALTYAEIPFDKLYADEVLAGELDKYDWLHLHHEDFTGQYGKFWASFRDAPWYKDDKAVMEAMAKRNGYRKVSHMQLAVVKKIKNFVGTGGNLFAMCAAAETFDIALAAEGTDICDTMFDGDPIARDAQARLDFSKCLAFRNFIVSGNPYEYSKSSIDNTVYRRVFQDYDSFRIVSPSAKLDQAPVMLCQNHKRRIAGFMGQATAFRKSVINPGVMILGERVQTVPKTDASGKAIPGEYYVQDEEARYIHGDYGKGSWTFLGGHDPEDYTHVVNDPPTDLSQHPNSPGYRLILNNVLVPSVKKTVVPTVVMASREATSEKVSDMPQNAPVKLYPDPANGNFIIESAGDKIKEVVVVNIAGEQMLKRTFNAAKVSISLNDLTSGIYLVKVNGVYAGKIIKE